jgi:hypothetical protein
MSLASNVCFLIVYHYEKNAILALPIVNLEGNTIFEGNKKQFEFIESKGNKIRLNVMDNQASRQIKKISQKMNAISTLLSPTTTMSMPPNASAKPSRTTLSVP